MENLLSFVLGLLTGVCLIRFGRKTEGGINVTVHPQGLHTHEHYYPANTECEKGCDGGEDESESWRNN